MGGGRWAWIFGDTLLGTVSERCPSGLSYCDRSVEDDRSRGMIPNSVGITQRQRGGAFSPIVKFWRVKGGQPAPIFDALDREEFLWPLAAVKVGRYLLVAASRHTRARGLRSLGTVFLRVTNPEARPNAWSFTRHRMPQVDAPVTWSTALVRADRYVYVFGKRGDGPGARSLLARFRAEDVEASRWTPTPEYLLRGAGNSGQWSRILDATRLYEIEGLPGTSEATVGFDDTLGWYTYQIPPFAFEIRLYTANRLAGPWQDRGVVYRIPGPWSTSLPRPGDSYVAYAAKAHPELAAAGGQVLSYNVNVASGCYTAAELTAEHVHGFYVPQMISRGPRQPANFRSGRERSSRTELGRRIGANRWPSQGWISVRRPWLSWP